MISTYYKTDDKEEIEILKRRNELLLAFFHANGITNIHIMGNAASPMMIYNDQVRLACYVSEFNLILLEKVDQNKMIGMLALDRDKVLDAESILLDFLYNSEHADVFRVSLTDMPGLFIAGYSYRNKLNKTGREPVFSILDARIFQSKEKAQELIVTMPGYNLEII